MGVMPSVTPTVARAEAASKAAERKWMSSVREMVMAMPRKRTTTISVRVRAKYTTTVVQGVFSLYGVR